MPSTTIIYVLHEYGAEFSAGSDPGIETLLFTTPELREEMIVLWHKRFDSNKYFEKHEKEEHRYDDGKWTYWLVLEELPVNTIPEFYNQWK